MITSKTTIARGKPITFCIVNEYAVFKHKSQGKPVEHRLLQFERANK